MPENTFPLGRLVEFDERSRQFPIRELFATAKKPRSYTWKCPIFLDQGQSSSCVGHSWAHEIAARPAVDEVDSSTAFGIYHRAQQLDEWPGENYDGTSILAGAKATMETGRIAEYRWAFGLEDLVLSVGYAGPAVVGTVWTDSMFFPDDKGFISATGREVGGHAYLINGVNITGSYFKIHNSWGRSWGDNGTAKISFADMENLLYRQGEACIPVKRVRSY